VTFALLASISARIIVQSECISCGCTDAIGCGSRPAHPARTTTRYFRPLICFLAPPSKSTPTGTFGGSRLSLRRADRSRIEFRST
jgi:hypothetical protein